MDHLEKVLDEFKREAYKPTNEEVLGLEIKRVDGKVDLVKSEINHRIDVVETELGDKAEKAIKIAEQNKKQKGEKGDNYILTSSDKKEIAKLIKVPIVDRVVEKTEVIKEIPIVTENKVEIIKEVALKDSGDEIITKINEVGKDGNKIKSILIEGYDKTIEDIKASSRAGRMVGGSRGLQLYVDGSKKGIANYVNLIAGTNITLTYSYSNGRNDILIDGSGGAGFTKLTATGSVDGSNTAFTFTQKPLYIISDGAWYQENKGWTWSDPTATMSVPPQTDIYGFV